MFRTLFLTALLLSRLHSEAQQPPPEVVVTAYNETNGVTEGKLNVMLQSPDGFLWFGTSNGLLRFDGYSFRSFRNPQILNSITKLAADSAGNIWMSYLGGGIGCFNPATGVHKNYQVNIPNDSAAGKGEVECMFFDSKGRMWLSITRKGFIQADPEKGRYTLRNIISDSDTRYTDVFRKVYNTVYNMADDGHNNLWLGTHDGLYKFNTSSNVLSRISDSSLVRNGNRLDLFGNILYRKGEIWLGAWAGGISCYNIRKSQWRSWLPKDIGLSSNMITAIAFKDNDELWITSTDLGLGTLNMNSGQFFFYNSSSSNVPGGAWYKMITDRENNVWALHNTGLIKLQFPDYKFRFQPYEVSRSDATEGYEITDWFENDQYRLIATAFADGLHLLNKQTHEERILGIDRMTAEERFMRIQQIMEDSRHAIWVISRDYLYHLDQARGLLFKVPQPPLYTKDKPSNSFVQATEDNDGRIWIASRRNGVFVWDPATQAYLHYGTSERGAYQLPIDYIHSIARDARGRIWIASSYGFLGYIDDSGVHAVQDRRLLGNQTYLLYADADGNIWAGTFYGVCRFECTVGEPVVRQIFNAGAGLRSNLISSISQDQFGNIWCISEVGLSRITPRTGNIATYDANDGLTSNKIGVKLQPLGRDSMRMLAFAGYYTFSINDGGPHLSRPPLRFTRMLVDDRDFFYQSAIDHDGKVQLQPDQNTFSIEFAALSINRPSHQLYEYMLEGLDKNWIRAEGRRFISYSNVSGGNYRFRVRVADELDPTTMQEIQLPLFIKTPFHKTIYFLLLVLLVTALIIFAIYKGRLDHHRQLHSLHSKTQLLEKEKAMVMYDALKQQLNPHFLFNSLSSLSSLINSDQKMADNFLGHLSSIYRYILKNRDRETVSVDEEIRFVQQYIELQKTRFKEGLQVHVNVSNDARGAKTTPVVLQNLVENAIKHNVTDRDSPLNIEIYDDADDNLVVRNNLQSKGFVETSNQQGLQSLKTLYSYYTSRPLIVEDDGNFFTIKIPLL